MGIHFRTLLKIEIVHDYYGGLCRDLDFIVPPGEPALAAGRLHVRMRDGRLLVLYEANDTGAPLRSIAGAILFVGLRVNNPAFGNFTQPPVAEGLPLFANVATNTLFAPPESARFIVANQRIAPAQVARPLALGWTTGALTIAERTLVAEETETVFETRSWPAGRYRLSETAGGTPKLTTWLQLPALAGEGLWGVLAVTVDGDFYANPPTLTVPLQARSDVVKYYVVARNYGNAEFGQLALTDAGAAEQARPALVFDKVLPADFAADDIPPAALGDSSVRIALFRSQLPVARRAGGYRKLQLKRNNDILVQHLPQAGSDRAQAHFIVHLAKS